MTIRDIAAPLWTSWTSGPVTEPAPRIVVSLTEFTTRNPLVFFGVVAKGLELRRGWYAMDGAVGLSLWAQPLRGRGGSLSIWQDEQSLLRFIDLPRHVEIMRAFGPLIRVRSVRWTQDLAGPPTLITAARGILDAPSGTPLIPPRVQHS